MSISLISILPTYFASNEELEAWVSEGIGEPSNFHDLLLVLPLLLLILPLLVLLTNCSTTCKHAKYGICWSLYIKSSWVLGVPPQSCRVKASTDGPCATRSTVPREVKWVIVTANFYKIHILLILLICISLITYFCSEDITKNKSPKHLSLKLIIRPLVKMHLYYERTVFCEPMKRIFHKNRSMFHLRTAHLVLVKVSNNYWSDNQNC